MRRAKLKKQLLHRDAKKVLRERLANECDFTFQLQDAVDPAYVKTFWIKYASASLPVELCVKDMDDTVRRASRLLRIQAKMPINLDISQTAAVAQITLDYMNFAVHPAVRKAIEAKKVENVFRKYEEGTDIIHYFSDCLDRIEALHV